MVRGIAALESDFGPSVNPGDGGDLQIGGSGFAVVGVEDDDVVFLLKDGFTAGAEPAGVAEEQGSSATFEHGGSAGIDVGAGHGTRARDHGFIVASGAAAA